MGGGKGGLPLTFFPGRETTSDTLLLADAVSALPYRICFDLGTGTGGIFKNTTLTKDLRIGIDFSFKALTCFDTRFGQPVLCSVEQVSSTFRKACADLVVANPPYHIRDRSRRSSDEARDQARSGDALALYRFIFAGAHLLRRGGTIIVTTRGKDIERVSTGLQAAGFISLEIIRTRGVFAVKGLLGDSLGSKNSSSEISGI